MTPLFALILAFSPLPLGIYSIPGNSTTHISIEIKPNAQFRYELQGCFKHREMTGRYTLQYDILRLPKGTETPRELAVVNWDGITLLVPTEKMDYFCERYRAGWQGQIDFTRQFQLGSLYVSAPYASLKGKPSVPSRWVNKLHRK